LAEGKYKYWLTSDGLILLKGWAEDGLTDELIANCKIGISRSTFYEWKKKYPAIADALKNGKELPDYNVQNALYRNALAGDTTAQIFWLKNRRSDKWKDSPWRAELDKIKFEYEAELNRMKFEHAVEMDKMKFEYAIEMDSKKYW